MARGAREFRAFYESTPEELLRLKIFDTIALPLYSSAGHRSVCIRHIHRAMGASRSPLRSLASLLFCCGAGSPRRSSALGSGRQNGERDGRRTNQVGCDSSGCRPPEVDVGQVETTGTSVV